MSTIYRPRPVVADGAGASPWFAEPATEPANQASAPDEPPQDEPGRPASGPADGEPRSTPVSPPARAEQPAAEVGPLSEPRPPAPPGDAPAGCGPLSADWSSMAAAAAGASALGIGLIPYTNHLAAIAGLVALVLVMFVITRSSAGRTPNGASRAAMLFAIVAAALAILSGVAGMVITSAALPGNQPPSPSTDQAASRPESFGSVARRADGWDVGIDPPSPYRLGRPAVLPDGAARSAELQVTLTNRASAARDSSSWSIDADANGQPVTLLFDPARNRQGVPSQLVQPGTSVTFHVVVALPADPVRLRVTASTGDSAPTEFVGQS